MSLPSVVTAAPMKLMSFPKRSGKGSQLMLVLVGVATLYKIAYHSLVMNVLPSEEDTAMRCDGGGFESASPECLEIHLFRSWRSMDDDAAEFALVQRASSISMNSSTFAVSTVIASKVVAPTTSVAPAILPQVIEVDAGARSNTTPWSPLTAWGHSLETLQDRLAARQARLPSILRSEEERRRLEFDNLYNQTLAAIHSRTGQSDWARAVLAMQSEFDKKNSALHNKYHENLGRGHETIAAEGGRLQLEASHDKTSALIEHRSGRSDKDTHMGADLGRMNAELHRSTTQGQVGATIVPMSHPDAFAESIEAYVRELCADPARREYSACANFLPTRVADNRKQIEDLVERRLLEFDKLYNKTYATIHNQSGLSAWARELAALQDEFTRKYAELHDTYQTSAAQDVPTRDMLAETIQAYGRELCSDPARRGYAACASFLAAGEVDVGTQPRDTSLKSSTPSAGVTTYSRSALRGSGSLSWAAVKESHSNHEEGLVVVAPNDLMSGKWADKIPTVACISVVSSNAHGGQALERLKYVVDNFRFQNYEGEKQLLLLYHFSDSVAGTMLRELVDGSLIRAVGVGNAGPFPDTSTMRYAAWLANADIIARWDFDDWHHPQRLRMQIRSMALTKRKVSLLSGMTILGDGASGNAPDSDVNIQYAAGIGWAGSIVGDKAWMQAHWFPLLASELELPGTMQFHDVVQVQMPQLLAHTHIATLPDIQGAAEHAEEM